MRPALSHYMKIIDNDFIFFKNSVYCSSMTQYIKSSVVLEAIWKWGEGARLIKNLDKPKKRYLDMDVYNFAKKKRFFWISLKVALGPRIYVKKKRLFLINAIYSIYVVSKQISYLINCNNVFMFFIISHKMYIVTNVDYI